MNNFFLHFITLLEFLIGFFCFYASIHVEFSIHFFNTACFVIGIFIIIEACGKIDKLIGYGTDKRDLKSKKPNEEK